MSRASEITLFLILLQASIGFVDSIGLFSQHYVDVPSNNASYTISDLNTYTSGTQDRTWTDDVMLLAYWTWEAMFIAVKILFTVAFVMLDLVTVFHVPIELSVFIQAGIYYVYATWYAQYKSGKGWRLYE